jgi:hypothetical protein
MRDTFLKRTEILFRRLLIRALRYVYKRKNDPDSSGDYNSCKFLFIRQDRIGDVLVSIPSIHLLKKKYPGASIDFILSENNYFVLDNDPVINRKWIYRKNILKIA